MKRRGTNTLFWALLVMFVMGCALLPQGTNAALLAVNDDVLPTSTATWRSPTTGVRYPLPCAKVTAIRSLYLRNSAGGAVIGWYGPGQIVEIIGQVKDGWTPVQTDFTQGWVSQAYLEAVECP